MVEQKRGRGRPRKNPEAPVVKSKSKAKVIAPKLAMKKAVEKKTVKLPAVVEQAIKESKPLPVEQPKVTRKVSNKKGAVVVEAEQDIIEKEKGHSIQFRGGKPVKVEDSDEIE